MTEFIKPKRSVHSVFLHCSASDNSAHDNIATIRKWHIEGNKWADVGYHYFIRSNGTIEAGRPLEKIPAAQAGFNTGTIAICMHGLTKFSKEQEKALTKLCKDINKAYAGQIRFRGHKEVAARECPVYDYKKILKLNDKGLMPL
jgi:N-acetyl-anhydromuramyl-L-alanine amidase AmpD